MTSEQKIAQLTEPGVYEVPVDKPDDEMPLDMEVFSLTGTSKELRKKMLTDRHVLKNIAILGQATIIYAKPNTGKTLLTLRLLCDSIKEGEIDGADVMFINADDTYQGLITKIEIAEEVGFNVLAPGYQNFEANRLIEYMSRMVLEETARGKVLVLDTIKKFVSLMDKKESSLFMHAGRQFVVKGGTLIMLAHTNKNRDADGKLVYSGTSDLVDDADCAFILDEVDGHNDYKHVLFENIKARGCVARELAFRYLNTDDSNYLEVLNSVSVLNDDDTKKIKAEKAVNSSLEQNADLIKAIIETINSGVSVRTDLVKVVNKEFGFPIRKVRKMLEDHEGANYEHGGRWISTNTGANKFSYQITPETGKCL